ncbi:MAG: S-adenosyl-l-methionine hydroxide adenosyltransferase family protein [Candidatus Methanoperedens sp.]|nr:S-adenosyl-l-methionine hydroxide adenosyltransferase family protein [Candidatus Methanoperedens sp.]MCZ7359643.1 S-adenosyl-l-methionine hydroxide adenosyltransferase family protein [Candidatus Methanoperedens sp.]HLB70672.1 S-adenosyl-l-methionine hydroxide adenosyltransferase family protein [Candidatus Methanoperedens sp.]
MVITLLSDFGDVYPASMKGVILSINPGTCIVDISHSVPRHDVHAGAFILMTCARYFPSGTVHIAVVDPGVGTERRAIAIKAVSGSETHYFVGPDNGLLIPAAGSAGEIEVHEITNRALFLKNISGTFHGRDVFSPVGAHISKGLKISDVGRQIFDFVTLDFGEGKKENDRLKGNIIFIDSFGNMVTNISSGIADLEPGDRLEIQGKRISFLSSYGFSQKGEPLALTGSHGNLEIAVNQGNAALSFNKKKGDEVVLRKIT